VRTVRRLPLRVEPVEDEAFASYLARLAADLDCPLTAAIEATGLSNPASSASTPAGFGIEIAGHKAALFAAATGLELHQVHAMQLRAYEGVLVERALEAPTPALVTAGRLGPMVNRWWIYARHTHACRDCLTEAGGAWRRRWKLPWSIACLRHRRLLLDSCPGCGGRLTDRCLVATVRALAGLSPLGRCGAPLLDARATPRAWRRVLEAQAVLDDALNGALRAPAGDLMSLPQFFAEMRSLVETILYVVQPEAVRNLPRVARDAVEAHVSERDATNRIGEEQRRMRGGRGGTRHRVAVAAPTNAALLAAVVPWALEIVSAPSDAEQRRRLEPLWKLADQGSAESSLRLAGWFNYSPRLATNWRSFSRSRQTLPGRAGLHRRRERVWGFGVESIPQLIWRPVYDRAFAPFMPGIGGDRARRHVALCLANMAGVSTWEDAAAALGLDPIKNRRRVHILHFELLRAGTDAAFIVRLHALARSLERIPLGVDYGRRRRVFDELDDLDVDDWAGICERAQLRRAIRGDQARSNAAVWLWTQLTGGDWRCAPTYRSLPLELADNRRRSFERYHAAPLQVALRACAAELLQRARIAEPLEPDLTKLRLRPTADPGRAGRDPRPAPLA
jgi:hypothetical protein